MMLLEELRQYCLSKPFTTEELPFDEVTLVYKVMGKMFALAATDEWGYINLKCDPDEALERRAAYESVQPGCHMNKKHWITVPLDGSVPQRTVLEWIDDSFHLVVASLPKAKRSEVASALEEFKHTKSKKILDK
jgi:predicted DNA-binding protein (MmcQ/YjbR family)